MATNDIHIASGPNAESHVPDQLRAGDGDFLTRPVTILTGEVLPQYSVVARVTASGKFVEWDPAANTGAENALGITCYAVDATSADVVAAIYVSGYFNTDAIAWPAGTTAAQKESAFDGTAITHRSLWQSVP